MKKLFVILFALMLSMTLFACNNEVNNEDIKVGLIVSAAGANDNGYNQYAIDGLNDAATEFGV